MTPKIHWKDPKIFEILMIAHSPAHGLYELDGPSYVEFVETSRWWVMIAYEGLVPIPVESLPNCGAYRMTWWIHAGFPGSASVYYYCDDMPSMVMYEYQWDAS